MDNLHPSLHIETLRRDEGWNLKVEKEKEGRKGDGREKRETLWGGKDQDRRRKERLLLRNALTIIIKHSKTQIITP